MHVLTSSGIATAPCNKVTATAVCPKLTYYCYVPAVATNEPVDSARQVNSIAWIAALTGWGAAAGREVYQGMFGPWSIEPADEFEVLTYRLGLTATAAGEAWLSHSSCEQA